MRKPLYTRKETCDSLLRRRPGPVPHTCSKRVVRRRLCVTDVARTLARRQQSRSATKHAWRVALTLGAVSVQCPLCKRSPRFGRHQKAIIGALKEGDISIRRRALDLMFTMCNAANAAEVWSCGHLFAQVALQAWYLLGRSNGVVGISFLKLPCKPGTCSDDQMLASFRVSIQGSD